MNELVLAPCDQLEILNGIIEFVSVSVMKFITFRD